MMSLIERAVFSNLSSKQQTLLKAISICDEFSKEELLYLYRDSEASDIFDALYQDDCYIRLDRKTGQYYVFEPLKLYLKEYNKVCPKTEYEERINRLAHWYLHTEENNPQARMLFHSIHNYDALMEAVERRRFLVFYGLDEQEFISYYTDCPLNIRAKHPKAVMTFARQMFSLGNYEMGKNTCAEFETIIGNYQDQDKNNLLGTYQLLLSYAEYNNLDAMIEHLQMAKTYMQDSKSAFLWPETELNESYSLVFMFHSKSGELDNEIQAYTKYVSLFSEVVNDNLNGTVELIMAEKEYLQGNMLDAEILLNKAVMKIQRNSQWNRKLCT